jgi:transposase
MDMARHYGVAIVPARVRKPRDKAKVEKAVQDAERAILAPLRHRTFFELGDLAEAIRERLDAFNGRHSKWLGGSRQELFERIDKPALRPLPTEPYEYADWRKARVNIDYHVSVSDHCYSVPHGMIHKPVEVRITANTVEIFHANERIASHLRCRGGGYSTIPDHMPEGHRAYSEWSPERFVRWAHKFGPDTVELVQQVLASRSHPEQAYRACLGILRLGEKHGGERLEDAARRALAAGAIGYRHVNAILQARLGEPTAPETPSPVQPIEHENIRGSAYFSDAEGDD